MIKVHSAALNFPDLLMVAGKYQVKPPLPFSPGLEVAGIVDSLGSGVVGLRRTAHVGAAQSGRVRRICRRAHDGHSANSRCDDRRRGGGISTRLSDFVFWARRARRTANTRDGSDPFGGRRRGAGRGADRGALERAKSSAPRAPITSSTSFAKTARTSPSITRPRTSSRS